MAYEKRREGEMTTMFLSRVLEDYLGLRDMARRARLGHFDDYFCPKEIMDGLELHRLVWELEGKLSAVNSGSPQAGRIIEVIHGVMNGDFDGTKQEAERWGASKEGQETFRRLLGGE